jgi:K+-transporting ATPase ATPase A chain
MSTAMGWIQIVCVLSLVVAAAIPLGRFIADLFEGKRTPLTPILAPVERALYRVAGVDSKTEQGWLDYTLCMLALSYA